MRIDGIGNLTPVTGRDLGVNGVSGQDRTGALDESGKIGGNGFGEEMTRALGEVNNLQGNADVLSQKLATGDVEDIHKVMLALDKASTAFGLTVQVRNKVLEAYQEVMRMQV